MRSTEYSYNFETNNSCFHGDHLVIGRCLCIIASWPGSPAGCVLSTDADYSAHASYVLLASDTECQYTKRGETSHKTPRVLSNQV